MHAGEYIKWTGKDDEGTFSHIGKILSVNDVWVEFQTRDGKMCVKRTEKLELCAPIDLGKCEQVAKPTLDQPKRDVKEGSKLAQCVALYQTMKGASRKELIEAFVTKIGMTAAGASTYAAQVRKVA